MDGSFVNAVEPHKTHAEAHQPIAKPHSQPQHEIMIPTTAVMDATITDKLGSPTIDESMTLEALANICQMQRQTIAVLVEEKSALTTELEKYSVMADRFKSSEELLEEGQLIMDGLRRQNAELAEKIRTGDAKLQEAAEDKERTLESLRNQVSFDSYSVRNH